MIYLSKLGNGTARWRLLIRLLGFFGVLGVDGRIWTEPNDNSRDISRLLRSFEIREAVGGSPTSLPKGTAEQVGSFLRGQWGESGQSSATRRKVAAGWSREIALPFAILYCIITCTLYYPAV